MNIQPTKRNLAILGAVALLAVPAVAAALDGPSPSANKAGAAASDFVRLGTAAAPLGPTVILDTLYKAGGPQDLFLEVSLECSLVTEVVSTTIDDHPNGYTALGRAEAHVVVWILVDGVAATVGGDDEDGKVTFCDRVHEQEISDIDDDTGNFTIRQLQETMTANSFTWPVVDLGSGLHTIQVFATIEAANTEGSFAQGAIEKRTLAVEPVHFANGFSL